MADQISPVINSLRLLSLSPYGKIYLSIFDDNTLWNVYMREFTIIKKLQKDNREEAFKHFFNECCKMSQEFNHDKVKRLGILYNMPEAGIYPQRMVIK